MNTETNTPTPETDALCEKLSPLVTSATAETFGSMLETILTAILTSHGALERDRDALQRSIQDLSHANCVMLLRERDEALNKIAEIGDYLWPNQTGLPNKHRDVLLAIKTRDSFAEENAVGLAKERDEAVARAESKHRSWMSELKGLTGTDQQLAKARLEVDELRKGRECYTHDLATAWTNATRERDALRAELEEAKADIATAIEDSNRSRQIVYAMSDALKPKDGEHNIDCAKRAAAELEAANVRLAWGYRNLRPHAPVTHEMKTAEEWKALSKRARTEEEAMNWIRAIQLEAIRHGMTLAAEIVESQGCKSLRISAKGYANLILDERDKKTTI